MEDIIEATKHVNRLLRESREYRRFIHARGQLRANEELYQKLRELKEQYKEIQAYRDDNPYDEIYKLCDENDWLLHNSVVNEYLRAESALSRLIRRMMEEVTADLVVDYE